MVDRFATKLVVAALVVSAVPLAILGSYAYTRIARSVEQTAASGAVDRVSQAARSIRDMQSRTEKDALFLARWTALRASQGEPAVTGTPGGRSPGERRLDRYLASFIHARTQYRGVRYLDAAGNEILRVDANESEPQGAAAPEARPGESAARSELTGGAGARQPEAGAAASSALRPARGAGGSLSKPAEAGASSAEAGSEHEDFVQTLAVPPEEVYVSPAFVERGPAQAGPGELLMRYGAPVLNPQGKAQGVVLLTVAVDELLHQAREALSGEDVISFVADERGHYLHHTVARMLWNAPENPEAESVLERDFPLAPQGLAETPVVKELGDGRVMVVAEVRAAGARQPDAGAGAAGWIVGQVYRRDDIFRPVVAFRWTFLVIVVVTTVIAALVAAGLAHHLTGPVRELQAGTRLVGSGELDHRIPVRSRDEFGELAASFNTMSQRLAEHLQRIQETTAARARTEGELATARDIQQALLPRTLPPSVGSLDVFGGNIPAYEVGGDFYDCQPVGEDRVMFALGDVSGKGVPAALLMTMTSTLLRTFALESRSPRDILTRTNRALLLRGDPRTFVTVFLALYHVRDRRLVFANAGHPGPFLVTSAGRMTSLEGGDTPLGVWGAFQPEDGEVQFDSGDTLFLYSDGLTEARDVQGTPFGTRRLADLVANSAAPSAQELYDEVIGAVMKHEAGAPQFDDLAVLIVKVK